MKASTVPCSGQRPIHAPYHAFISTDAECASPRVASSDSQRGAVEELVGGRGDGPELADGPRFRRFCGGGSHAGVLRCLALRGSQTRPVEAILEICAMAQSSSHMSFACLQMPDELSALIQGIVRERVRRNWPLVRAFEIRSGRRSLQQGESVAVMPYIGDNSLTNAREPLWLGKGSGSLGSGGCSCDARRIQWLQHTTFKGAACWMEILSYGPVPSSTSSIIAAGFNVDPIQLPHRPPYAHQFTATCCVARRAFSVSAPVIQMLASACESTCAGYGADVRCWILIGVGARQLSSSLRLRLQSDGCSNQFAFRTQP